MLKTVSLGNDANISSVRLISDSGKDKVNRYKLLDFARHLLIKYDVKSPRGNNSHKTRKCHAIKSHNAEHVTIRLNRDDMNSQASIGNVQTCGSVWSCPVCATREMTEKGKRVKAAIDALSSNGYIPVMLAFTAAHDINTRLADFKGRFKKAWGYFASGRHWKEFKKKWGIYHYIVNREVTYGDNGFHYHQHALLFLDKSKFCSVVDNDAIQSELNNRWITACEREGLTALENIGVKVSSHHQASDNYMTKLGIVPDAAGELHYELTNTHGKSSKNIWDILRHAYYARFDRKDNLSELLYIEYVQALSGDNFMTFSHGLNEIVDQHLARAEDQEENESNNHEEMHDWYQVSSYWWWMVQRAKAVHRVVEMAAATRDAKMVTELLYDIRYELWEEGKISSKHIGKAIIRRHSQEE